MSDSVRMSVYVVVYSDPWTYGGGHVEGVFADLDAVRAWYNGDENETERPTPRQRKLPGYQGEFHPFDVQKLEVRTLMPCRGRADLRT